MNTNPILHFIATAFALTAFSTAGCSEKPPKPDTPVVSTTVTTDTIKASAAEPPVPAVIATSDSPDIAWIDLKDYTYGQRDQLIAGLKRLETRVDVQMDELTKKRAAINGKADPKDWDFAMKEMRDAQAYLKSTNKELGKATPEIWSQAKDKVGHAWVRSQEAYAKVKASTTI